MTIETAILTFGYFGIFCLMTVNGVLGFPSSSLLYLTAGFLIASKVLFFLPVVIVGTIGNTIGNIILYELSRRKGLAYIARWRMFSEKNIKRLQKAFELRGSVILFAGKLLSGVKVFVPVVAGIASMDRRLYVFIIIISSSLWAAWLTSLGFYFGKSFHEGTLGVWSIAPAILVAIAIYSFCRYVQSITLDEIES